MEIISPGARPKVAKVLVERDCSVLTIGESVYKLIFTTKMSHCALQHTSQLNKVVRYLPNFPSMSGFWLVKSNLAEECKVGATTSMGMSKAPARKRAIPLCHRTAPLFFDPAFVAALASELDGLEQQQNKVGKKGVAEEFTVVKDVVKYSAPTERKRSYGSACGRLVYAVSFSNYNHLRHAFGEGDDAGPEGPGMLGQIVAYDESQPVGSAPLVQFSCPARDLVAVLSAPQFAELLRRHSSTEQQDSSAGASGDESD